VRQSRTNNGKVAFKFCRFSVRYPVPAEDSSVVSTLRMRLPLQAT